MKDTNVIIKYMICYEDGLTFFLNNRLKYPFAEQNLLIYPLIKNGI